MTDFEFGSIPDGTDKIWAKKQVNDFLKQARMESKPKKCIVCGKSTTKLCNSHSVPRTFLKNIAEDGKVLQANGLVGVEVFDIEKGINNSGTFRFICNECDSTLFQTYENPESIKKKHLSDKLLAEIALKDVLLMLSKRNIEKTIFKKSGELGAVSNVETMFEIQSLDESEFKDEMDLFMHIDDSSSGNFHIIYHAVLPYTTPIAVQTALVIRKDLEETVINDIYDLSPDLRMQYMHISVFPLENETVVLMFYHRRDKNYRGLLHQFNCLSDEEKLRYINYLIFKYTENYFFAPSFKMTIEENPKLAQLSRESNELPNFGHVNIMTMMQYKPVKITEVPNLLNREYALSSTEQ